MWGSGPGRGESSIPTCHRSLKFPQDGSRFCDQHCLTRLTYWTTDNKEVYLGFPGSFLGGVRVWEEAKGRGKFELQNSEDH